MNTSKTLRNQIVGRAVLLILVAVAINWIAGWIIHPAILVLGLLATPSALAFGAYVWGRTYEWMKLGVNEDYARAASQRMAQQMQEDLRDSLDVIGQEAYDEVQRAIQRRDGDG
jgi:hypothetical protein